jgi:hypothetical protein
MNLMPGVTYPYEAHPDSNVMPVLDCEQDNPAMQYTIPADQILAIHRCLGLVPADVALYEPGTGKPQHKRAFASAGAAICWPGLSPSFRLPGLPRCRRWAHMRPTRSSRQSRRTRRLARVSRLPGARQSWPGSM